MTVIIVDLTDKAQRDKLNEVNPKNPNAAGKHVDQGRTCIGYDKETGDILFAIDEKGKFIHTNNKNIIFKNIIE